MVEYRSFPFVDGDQELRMNFFLGYSLSDETMSLLARAKKKGMPFFVTPYYLSLLNIEHGGV